MYQLVVLFLLVTHSLFGQADNWQRFGSIDGNFEVLVPGGAMERKQMMVETPIGDIQYEVYFLQQEETADNWLYMVSYCDYPEGAIHSDSTELVTEFFKQSAETAVESVQGELMYAAATDWGEYPGYHWRIDFGKQNKSVVRTKAILIGNRYYALQAFCFEGMSLNPSISKFMDSFSLLAR